MAFELPSLGFRAVCGRTADVFPESSGDFPLTEKSVSFFIRVCDGRVNEVIEGVSQPEAPHWHISNRALHAEH